MTRNISTSNSYFKFLSIVSRVGMSSFLQILLPKNVDVPPFLGKKYFLANVFSGPWDTLKVNQRLLCQLIYAMPFHKERHQP